MSDFLTRLIDRTLGLGEVVKPSLEPLFGEDPAIAPEIPGIADATGTERVGPPSIADSGRRSGIAGASQTESPDDTGIEPTTDVSDGPEVPAEATSHRRASGDQATVGWQPGGGESRGRTWNDPSAGSDEPSRRHSSHPRIVEKRADVMEMAESRFDLISAERRPHGRTNRIATGEASPSDEGPSHGPDRREDAVEPGDVRTGPGSDPGSAARVVCPRDVRIPAATSSDISQDGRLPDSAGSRQRQSPPVPEHNPSEPTVVREDDVPWPVRSEPPTVKVTIGRIDVQAVKAPTVPRPRRAAIPQSTVSLQDYLREAKGGQR